MQDSFLFVHVLNLFDLLLLTTFVLSVVLAVPLLIKRDAMKSDYLLAGFVLSQGLYAFFSVMLHNETLGPKSRAFLAPFEYLPLSVIFASQGLLLLWFCRAIMGKSVNLWGRTTRQIGYLLVTVLTINTMFDFASFSKLLALISCSGILLATSVVQGFKAFQQVSTYEVQLPFLHSNLHDHSLAWLKTITSGFLTVWLMTVLGIGFDIIGVDHLAEWFYHIRHLPPLVLVAAMVIYSQSHRTSHSPVDFDAPVIKEEPQHNTTNDLQLSHRLNDIMTRVKVYQDPDLRLDGLADCLGISPRNLSALLHRHYKKNFYEFINHYRVRDAESQLNNETLHAKTIQRIFEDAGFNSKTTFNTLFKKQTGLTPSEYRKKHTRMKTVDRIIEISG